MKEIKLTGYHADWSRTGEHNAVALLVDASEFLRLWPDGVPQTIYRRPDKTTYPVPCELEDEYVHVVLTSTETAITGMASLELQWIDDGAFARSATYSGRINTALDPDGEPGTPPDPPGQSWLDQAIAVGAGVALDRNAVSGMLDEVETLTGEARDIAQDVGADRDATHGYMQRAETAADGAEDSAGAAAASLDKLTNLTATAETLSPGSAATVVKTATPDGYALAFGIPRGDKGEQGERGETGATGERGLKGEKGDTGSQGETGAKGDQGDKGDKGDTGAKGDKGDPGEVTQVQLNAVTSQLADIAHSVGILSGDVSSWGAVQQLVQDGFGQAAFPVGSQLRTNHTAHGEIIWDVVAHDHHKNPDDPVAHTMTLLMNRCIYGRPVDATEALYYCETGLAAGTYNFTLLAGYDTAYGGGKTFQFTLDNAVPAGGQIMFPWAYNVNASLTKIATYASNAATDAIESNISVIEGTGGNNLGTADGNTLNMNHVHRIRYGSNHYGESALRQRINSNAAANAWWQPSNIFDRPPSYANVAGFVNGLPADFIDAVGAVDIDVIRNTIYEVDGVTGGSYTLRDKFFLPSMTELGLGNNNSIAEGSVLAYYANATQADRIKYDIASSTTARYWWLRSPDPSHAYRVRSVSPDGALSSSGAYYGHGAAPACVIM